MGGAVLDKKPTLIRIVQFVDAVFHSERANRMGAPHLHNLRGTPYEAHMFGALFVAAILAYTEDPLFPDNAEFNGTLNPDLLRTSRYVFEHLEPFRDLDGALPTTAAIEIDRIAPLPNPHITIGRILVDGLTERKYRVSAIAQEALLAIQLTFGQGHGIQA